MSKRSVKLSGSVPLFTLLSAALLLAGCAGAPALITPSPEGSGALTPDTAALPAGTALPVATTAPGTGAGSATPAGGAVSGPIVGTSLPSTGPRLSPPLSSISPVPPGPRGGGTPLAADPSGTATVTREDNGRTVTLRVGQTLQLALAGYEWSLAVANPAILTQIGGDLPAGTALFKATGPGTTALAGGGDPPCRKAHPPCGLMSIAFSITVIIH